MRREWVRAARLVAALAVLGLGMGLLSGCTSPPERAEILVSTAPPGAFCILARLGQPIAAAGPTPAIALVDPTATDIAVTCRRNGFEEAVVLLPPRAASTYEQRLDIALAPRSR